MDFEPIGLVVEKRSDFELRDIFVEAFSLVAPFLTTDGNWISQAHECQAYDALTRRFPEYSSSRLFAILVTISSVRASGRQPKD